jgi:hypothetical protein
MIASRDFLKDENKLLVNLEKTASGSPAGQSWVRYFREWREGNEGLIRQSDSAFNQDSAPRMLSADMGSCPMRKQAIDHWGTASWRWVSEARSR